MTRLSPEPHEAALDHLITRVALHDRSAFDTLYMQTSGKLFAVAMRITKDRAEAEDVLQEAFIRVWQRAQSFRPGQARAISWLIAITRNLAIDRLRARVAPSAPIELAERVPDGQPTPEAAAATSEKRAQIETCLDELEERRADAVKSAYLEGYSYQDLADRYDTPINTIRTWLRRSLIHLRDCLEQSVL
ncbi:MAG: sigma-70 family RNA polymerase sigma factor [Pseudomonadota bacterium]